MRLGAAFEERDDCPWVLARQRMSQRRVLAVNDSTFLLKSFAMRHPDTGIVHDGKVCAHPRDPNVTTDLSPFSQKRIEALADMRVWYVSLQKTTPNPASLGAGRGRGVPTDDIHVVIIGENEIGGP